MPTFTATLTIKYTDSRDRDIEREVEVTYTFAGGKDDLPVIIETRGNCFNGYGYDDGVIDDLVWEAICDKCDEAYLDWQNDHGDYMLEQRRDARMDAEMGQ